MGALAGLSVIGAYNGSNDLGKLLALIPDPDTAPANKGTQAGHAASFLDEISPVAAAQLRVELLTLGADPTNTDVTPADGHATASGQYTVTADDDTANLIVIASGLANLTLTNCAFTIRRAGTEQLGTRTVTESPAGSFHIADNGYAATAGDVVTWFARGG